MDGHQLAGFKQRLLDERTRLKTELENSRRFNLDQSQMEASQELSSYDNHPADLGSELFEREKDLALWNNCHENLERIREALGRMEDGNYGICEACGREIPVERLEALPQTSFCVDCRLQEDERYQNRERPIEEQVLWPPFGRTFLDGRDNVAFDGEDAWQAVGRYGTSESPSDVGGIDSYNDFYEDHDPETNEIVELTGQKPPFDLKEI